MAFNPNEHMMSLKGRDYLQVMWRLVWFREEKPLWSIDTELVRIDLDAKHAIFKAVISDENGMPKATGYGIESVKDFGDYIEKAETKAVGRALAMLGYGTQFAPELDECDRIVDSPVVRKGASKKAEEKPVMVNSFKRCAHCGKPIKDGKLASGKVWPALEIAKYAKDRWGMELCYDCAGEAAAAEKAEAQQAVKAHEDGTL